MSSGQGVAKSSAMVVSSNYAFERTVTHQVPSSVRRRAAAQRER